METFGNELDDLPEQLLARLTEAAYRVALKHRLASDFLKVQLDLWSALASVLSRESASAVIEQLPRTGRTIIGGNDAGWNAADGNGADRDVASRPGDLS